MLKTAFLDRDNFIVKDDGYVHKLDQLSILPGFVEFALQLTRLRYQLFIVTNQAGIARGYFSQRQSQDFTMQLIDTLAEFGITITDYSFCPHHPSYPLNDITECYCRKPNPGMILNLMEKYKINRNDAIMCGDKLSDVYAGVNARVSRAFMIDKECRPTNYILNSTNCYIVKSYDDIISKIND